MKQHVLKELNESLIYDWEDAYGVDNPDYLPYWVPYMPFDLRQRYLSECGHQFKDYTPDMLNSDYNWNNWSNTV